MASDAQPIRLAVQLNADDYARYMAILEKRQSTTTNRAILTGAVFIAIPVAFAARAVAALEVADPVAVELAGSLGLCGFLAGFFTFRLAFWIIRRRTIRAMPSSIPNAHDEKTVTLDERAITVTGKLSQASWCWPAISSVTAEQGLVLFWIGSLNAMIIPDRTFPNANARTDAISFAEARIAQAKSAI